MADALADAAARGLRHDAGLLTMRPVTFWLYVVAGALMIIGSAIAMPFIPARSR